MRASNLCLLLILYSAVAVAICSALHNTKLQEGLSSFLSPEEVAGVKASGTFITQLPEQSRTELGRVFGKSYNTQFKVILGFTLFDFLIALALAVVRKRQGIFGKIPVRTLENEFTTTEHKSKQDKDPGVVAGVVENAQEASTREQHI